MLPATASFPRRGHGAILGHASRRCGRFALLPLHLHQSRYPHLSRDAELPMLACRARAFILFLIRFRRSIPRWWCGIALLFRCPKRWFTSREPGQLPPRFPCGRSHFPAADGPNRQAAVRALPSLAAAPRAGIGENLQNSLLFSLRYRRELEAADTGANAFGSSGARHRPPDRHIGTPELVAPAPPPPHARATIPLHHCV
jgi:hypothetical protein